MTRLRRTRAWREIEGAAASSRTNPLVSPSSALPGETRLAQHVDIHGVVSLVVRRLLWHGLDARYEDVALLNLCNFTRRALSLLDVGV